MKAFAPEVEVCPLQEKFASARKEMSAALIERDDEVDLVLTALVQAEDQNGRLSEEELYDIAVLLLIAGKYGLSSARISQLRREFLEDWRCFQGEELTPSSSRSMKRR